jgi:Holliday junction resolvase-like predicted endonuclease
LKTYIVVNFKTRKINRDVRTCTDINQQQQQKINKQHTMRKAQHHWITSKDMDKKTFALCWTT